MKNYLALLGWLLCACVGCNGRIENTATSVAEEQPQPDSAEVTQHLWEVVTAEPSTVIKHGVDVKGYFDAEASPVSLSGPEHLSQSVGFEGEVQQTPIAYLNWYRITKGEAETHGEINLIDALAGTDSYTVKVGSPAFLLSPSQRLTDGPPDEVPEELNYFKVYELEGAPQLNKKIKLENAFAGSGRDRRVTAAAYLCLPAEEWHHEEYFGIENSNSCLVVYGLESAALDVSVTTIDQFGLHRLQLESSNWLCVSATMRR